ncbi:MAG: hypothetical protein JOZ15_02000, partial [Acidobacteria bacterium]|nr:hypothetical protein [Acidobacteriota bacterium]
GAMAAAEGIAALRRDGLSVASLQEMCAAPPPRAAAVPAAAAEAPAGATAEP